MKTLISALALTLSLTAVAAQTPSSPLPRAERRAVRIPIRHADPWFVKLALEGQPLVAPELSTIFGFFGAPPQTANQVNGLFTGGKLLVNPTDNSLWFYPD